MRGPSHTASVVEVSPEIASEVPGLEKAVKYWSEGAFEVSDWFSWVASEWGTAALAACRGERFTGYVLYAPLIYLPRARRYPLGLPEAERGILLASVGGDRWARRRLLVRAMGELRLRGAGSLEAVSSDLGLFRHPSTAFLLANGFRPRHHFYYRGLPYTLLRAELSNTVGVEELAHGLIRRVRFPRLRAPAPSPNGGGYTRPEGCASASLETEKSPTAL